MTSDDSSSTPNAYGGQSSGGDQGQPPSGEQPRPSEEQSADSTTAYPGPPAGEFPGGVAAQPTSTYPPYPTGGFTAPPASAYPGGPTGGYTQPTTAYPAAQPTGSQPAWNPVTGMTGWDPRVGPPGWAPQQPYSPPPPPVVQHGTRGLSPFGMPARHSWEIPLLVIVIIATGLAYLLALLMLLSGYSGQIVLVLVFAPLLVYLGRGMNYAAQRVNGVKMSPTQFPEGFRMVQEAAARFGMTQVPDAYVVTGNGQINAFASGHGFRRYVVVYSDLFEISGAARNPEALAFIIGHEVGHIAAGHVSYWRQVGMFLAPFLPIVGSSLIRSQEYTADNHGFCNRPQGAPTAMQTLAAGKYLNNLVSFDEMADRAPQEKGFFVWMTNAMASHPVLTWRMWALRDRSRHGKLFWRPDAPQRPPVAGPYGAPQPYGSPQPQYGDTATYHEYRPR